MTGLSERLQVTVWLTEAMAAGARQDRACAVLGLSARTVQRWQADEMVGSDRRPGRRQVPCSQLSESERIHLLAVANSAEFGHLSPSQIVPRLADRGEYLASEFTFYRVLKAENLCSQSRHLHLTFCSGGLLPMVCMPRHTHACRIETHRSAKQPEMKYAAS